MNNIITEKMVKQEAEVINDLMGNCFADCANDITNGIVENSKEDGDRIHIEIEWFGAIDRMFINMQRVGFSLNGITIQDQLFQHAYNKKQRLWDSVYGHDETLTNEQLEEAYEDYLNKQIAFCEEVFDDIDCKAMIEKVKGNPYASDPMTLHSQHCGCQCQHSETRSTKKPKRKKKSKQFHKSK